MSQPVSEPEPLPRSARLGALVFSSAAPVWRWEAGLRAAAAVGIPGAGLVAFGEGRAALFATFGAFAVLYGEGRAYRVRARVVATAGFALLASVLIGASLGSAIPPGGIALRAASVAMVLVPAVFAVYVIDALRLGPPGALFFALVGGGSLVAVESGADPGPMILATALGVASSVLVCSAGALIDYAGPQREAVTRAVNAVDAYVGDGGPRSASRRHSVGAAVSSAWSALDDARSTRQPTQAGLVTALRDANRRFSASGGEDADSEFDPTRTIFTASARPSVLHRLARSLNPSSHAAITAARVAVACSAAGAASIALDLQRPLWASISALVVLQAGANRVNGTVRALHRFLGTVGGVMLFALLHLLAPHGYLLIALVVLLQFVIELLVARNYAIAVVFITPVALLASSGGITSGPVTPIIRERMIETVVGVVVALATMYLVLPRAHRRTLSWTESRVQQAAIELIDTTSATPVGNAHARHSSRYLHFELEGTVRAGIDSAYNEPTWTSARWASHVDMVHHGHDLLAAYWTTEPSRPLRYPAQWRTASASCSAATQSPQCDIDVDRCPVLA